MNARPFNSPHPVSSQNMHDVNGGGCHALQVACQAGGFGRSQHVALKMHDELFLGLRCSTTTCVAPCIMQYCTASKNAIYEYLPVSQCGAIRPCELGAQGTTLAIPQSHTPAPVHHFSPCLLFRLLTTFNPKNGPWA